MDNLPIEDQLILDKLPNPDQQKTPTYLWDEDFQRVVVGMMLCDRYFLTQSLGLIKPMYFSSEVHRLITEILVKYFEEQRQPPSKIYVKQKILDRLAERNQDQDTFNAIKLLYIGELATVYEYYAQGGVGDMMPGLDSPEAILDMVVTFAKTQAMKSAFYQGLQLIRKNPSDESFLKLDELYKAARLVDRQTDIGLDYFNTLEERYARMALAEETKEVFTTGWPSIDRGLAGGGLYRGELGAVMALPGVGKSLSLVMACVKNMAINKKVLYISTEMEPDRIATRFDAQMAQIGQPELMIRKEEVWGALREHVRDYEDKRRLVIKQFASGTADVNTIRAYHQQLIMYGFRPDLIIVDYPGDMKQPANVPLHQSMQRILTDLRGFGVEEKHCTIIAVQPNRGATELTVEEFMDESKQGDSFGQNRVFDAFWTLNQTSAEQRGAVGRVFVSKARNGKSRYSFRIKYDYEKQTLSMWEISDDAYRLAMSRVKDTAAGEVNIDGIDARVNRVIKPYDPNASDSETIG